MEPSSHPGLMTSPEMTTSGNLDILAHTAVSQSADMTGLTDTSTLSGFPVLKIAENTTVSLPLLSQQIRIEGQPGGPMLSQAQLQKILGSADPEKRMSPGPLSIIPTTGFSDPGQQSPASLSQNSQIMHYRSTGSSGDAMLSAINYNENEILQDGGFDVTGNLGNLDDGLLGSMGNSGRLSENPGGNTFDLFDGESDTLTMEALSPGLIMTDSGSLSTVNTVTDSNDSTDASLRDDKKKQGKPKGKAIKGQVSPGKVGSLDCNICHKVFNNTSALAKHKLTHSDERKYLCTICEKKFKRQDHLNGHLMTHRDKKPYQCMVTGCDKSYCDARSLKRHLENYHQHSVEQIASEMVAAASTAAEVLAEVSSSNPVPPIQVSTSSKPTVQVKIGVPAVNSNSVKDAQVVLSDSSSLVEAFQGAKTDNKISTPHLMLTSSTNPSGTIRVAVPVSIPVMSNQNAVSDSQQAAIVYEAFIKQQQLQEQQQQQHQQQQLQSVQEQQTQGKKDPDQDHIQLLKQIHLQQMEQQVIAAATQLHQEQQQKQQQQQQQQLQQQNLSAVTWQDQSSVKSDTSLIQSPTSGERSPAYTEMSPGNPDGQPGVPTSPIRSPANIWYSSTSTGQPLVGTTPNNVTVADVKIVEEQSKPVVCTICQRRFKNVPALNGHMRLHGGYFKKDTALKEEKKKKVEMAPPALVPARQGLPSHMAPQSTAAVVKKSKGTPPMQSPPSEEMHALHWQQKQQEQQLHQQLQQQLQQQQLQQQQQQLQQQHELQQEQLQQQQQQLQHQLQQQLQQHHEVQQQLQQEQDEQQQLELLQLHQLQIQQAGLDAQQIEQLKLQLQQTQLQQQQQQSHQERQILFEQQQPQLLQQEQSSSFVHMDPSPQVPQSPHLPTSPHYPQSPHIPQSPRVPQSPQVPQSPGLAGQGTVDHLQSPAIEYRHQGLQQRLVTEGVDRSLIQTIQQMQLHSQGVSLDNIQTLNLQSAPVRNVQTINQTGLQDGVSDQDALQHLSVEPSVNVHHDNSAFQSQISGSFVATGHISNNQISSVAHGANNHTSEIVSQIITSLENLGEVPRGSMEQVHKSEPVPSPGVYTAGNGDFQTQFTSSDNNGMLKNSFTEFAQSNVVHNNEATPNHTPQFVPHLQSQPVMDSHASVKQELLKHLTSKPTSPRAAQNAQFSFHSNTNFTNVKQKLLTDHVKLEPVSNPISSTQQRNSEIKRRLSAGPEDFRSTSQINPSASSDNLRDHTISGHSRASFISQSDNFKPRMRSKSGDDYRLQKWHNEDPSFMRPRARVEDFAHRPRSKTDEHLAKWNNRDMLSRSDGAGVFRNPTSFAPNSFKIKRKNRPAPLIIPTHANMCGFQSRLRSPRILTDGTDNHNTAPVPYTPPPMLSPIRRGSGLFWSLSMSGTPQVPTSAAPPTPRASLIRSGSLASADDVSKDLSATPDQGKPLESDILPHVNIGIQYQAALPAFTTNRSAVYREPSREDMVWDPTCMKDNTEEDLQAYQELACCAAVRGNGSNVEHALHLLYLANGNIQKAMLMLMTGSCLVPRKHTLVSYTYQESDTWGSEEVDNYTQAILKYDKDFFNVAKEVKTKTVRQCVQFYYLWKKVLIDDHKRLRVMRRKREQDYNLRSTRQQPMQQEQAVSNKDETESIATEEGGREVEDEDEDMMDSLSSSSETQEEEDQVDKDDLEEITLLQNVSPVTTPPTSSPATPLFACDHPECNSSFTSKPALNAHLKIHVKVTKPVHTFPSPPYDSGLVKQQKTSTPPYRSPVRSDGHEESFPCKLCGRVFPKVKSRSAHMKVHRPDQDKEREKKAKAAKQQASALEKSVLDSIVYPTHNLANGPSSQL